MKPTRLRFATRFPMLLSLAALPAVLLAVPAVSFAKTAATLSFNVAARVEADGGGNRNIVQTTKGRVFLRGGQVRIETKVGEQNTVVLLLKPYVYRLLPASKAGVRYKSSTPSPELAAVFSNWPALLNQPSQIRAALSQKGARKTGTANIGGVAADVYSTSRWGGKSQNVKMWLRRADSLPMRVESKISGAKVTVNLSNYRRGQNLSPMLFAVPKNYKIREGQPPRAMG